MTIFPFALGIALCGFYAHHRIRVGLPIYGGGLAALGVASLALEGFGHEMAALIPALFYAMLFIKSQVIIVRHGLPEY